MNSHSCTVSSARLGQLRGYVATWEVGCSDTLKVLLAHGFLHSYSETRPSVGPAISVSNVLLYRQLMPWGGLVIVIPLNI